MKITLEDHGQDFLEFETDHDGNITATRPFQGWVWNGNRIVNKLSAIKRGTRLRLKSNRDKHIRTLRYPVERVTA